MFCSRWQYQLTRQGIWLSIIKSRSREQDEKERKKERNKERKKERKKKRTIENEHIKLGVVGMDINNSKIH